MKTSSPTPKVEKIKMRNIGMKSRLPETTSLIPSSTFPKLTLHILIVRKSLLWKIWSAQFLVFKICIDVSLEHKPEEACLRRLHLFLKKAAPRPGPAMTPVHTHHTQLSLFPRAPD